MSFITSILEQGLIYGILALGIYITYKILDFPDLTVDGSFPLGGSDHSCPPYKRNESIHHAGSFISGRSSCGNLYRTDPREV